MKYTPTLLDRRRALALLGGLGIAATLPAATSTCSTSTPDVTEGPYWVDEKLFRSDVRTDPTTGVARQGVPLSLAITVVNSTGGNCAPLIGAWLDIWHCDAIGIYSDESTYNPGGGTGNVNTVGQKFLRGYQITDSNGQTQSQRSIPAGIPDERSTSTCVCEPGAMPPIQLRSATIRPKSFSMTLSPTLF